MASVGLKALLAHGYFPKELPPPFTTVAFAEAMSSKRVPQSFFDTGKRSRACAHNSARVGSLRRRLSLPNPTNQFNVARVISENWDKLIKHIKGSPLSQSYPIKGEESDRALIPFNRELVMVRAAQRASARFLLYADIVRCYPSIYTHSIPWALHTKNVAKKNHSIKLLGNALDLWVRNGQDGQTLGIPIGPDTSLVIAEIVLAAVDKELLKRLDNGRGMRFYDDYELTFPDRASAETALNELQEVLSEYELALSSEKTKLSELPALLENEWVTRLREFAFREASSAQRTDLISYFDAAYALVSKFPDKTVLAYAIGRLKTLDVHPDNSQLLQQLMLQAVIAEPGTFSSVLSILMEAKDEGSGIEEDTLSEVIQNQILQHAPKGHGSEVAWAIWAAIAFKVPIGKLAAGSISGSSDCVVALIALDARERGLISGKFDTKAWEVVMTADDLYSPSWLLAYEASLHGWLKAPGGYVSNDSRFGYLEVKQVRFYDSEGLGSELSALPDEPYAG